MQQGIYGYYPSLAAGGRVWRCRFPRQDGNGFIYLLVNAWSKREAWVAAQVALRSNRGLVNVPAKPHCTRLKSKEDR